MDIHAPFTDYHNYSNGDYLIETWRNGNIKHAREFAAHVPACDLVELAFSELEERERERFLKNVLADR